MSKKLIPVTFPNGVEAAIKPISPLLLMQIEEANPPPPPPMQAVPRPDGTSELRPNPDAPGYDEVIALHRGKAAMRTLDFVIKRSLVFTMTDEMKAEVDALAADLAEAGVTDINKKRLYVLEIAYDGDFETAVELINKATSYGRADDPKSKAGTDASMSDQTESRSSESTTGAAAA